MDRVRIKRNSTRTTVASIAVATALALVLGNPAPAEAYIGPGAGFAFISSFFILFVTFFLGLLIILIWPFRLVIKAIFKKRPAETTHDVDRVIIVGLDGLDPGLTSKFMKEGKLPNFSKLKEKGTFRPLGTTLPSMSPVAWSSFITGVDPSRHNIFDFLNRDLRTYMPVLSSTKIEPSRRKLRIGKYNIPLGKASVKLLRKGRPFWSVLGEYDIFSSIIRVPMTFPPEKLHGTLLSAMCVPDLRGTQGTFSFYSSRPAEDINHTGGVQIPVEVNGGVIKTHIEGPDNSLVDGGGSIRIPMEIKLNGTGATARIDKRNYVLKPGEYTDWIRLSFKAGPGMKVSGICRLYLESTEPHFEMYMTPVNIDPEKPSLPISEPVTYSVYLSKLMGSYATLGLAEDTWALNERVIDEDAFLAQAYNNQAEREEMFFRALDKTRRGLVACVFDATDRIQHMFMRFLHDDHPAHAIGADRERYRGVIEELYTNMDDLLGEIMEETGPGDVLMVISDHGFKEFTRGVNLNSWLVRNGYMKLKGGKKVGAPWFADVDWDNTLAYTFGLSGIYINQKGRESKGIVPPEVKDALKREIAAKLSELVDEKTGKKAILKVYDSNECYEGPYRENGPDLIMGYNLGYRNSWGAAIGEAEPEVIMDNTKSWSGDHCIDPRLVPGVFFCNREINNENPNIWDIGPTVLELFGIEVPSNMTGRPLITEDMYDDYEEGGEERR